MEGRNLVFRNDDLSPSSDYRNVSDCYNVIKDLFPDSIIISCITLFSKYNEQGSVYPNPPFKDRAIDTFYDVDKFLLEFDYIHKLPMASHGLFHVNHACLSRDAQQMSILSSCNFLKTNMFCPPFNSCNSETIKICYENNIKIITELYPWKSLEHNKFDKLHRFWYFHSWRFTPDTLREVLTNHVSYWDKK